MLQQAIPAKADVECAQCLAAALRYLDWATGNMCPFILVVCPVCEDFYWSCISDAYNEYDNMVQECIDLECGDSGGGGDTPCWNDGQGGCIPPLY